MNGQYFGNAGVFLVQTLFGIYTLAVMLRFLLQWVRADFYNPLVQFLVKITNPVLIPLRRFIPGLFGLDMAAVVLILALKMLEWFLVYAIVGREVGLPGLVILALADTLSLLVNVMFWAIIIRAVLSWVNPDYRQPVVALLVQLTEPLLRPARGLIPPISGFDLSPIAVLILLQLTKILLIAPLLASARQLL